MSGLTLVTAPTTEPITLTDIKDHLRIDTDIDSEVEEINSYISAARRWCEHFQNRAYISQTWDWALDEWPASPFPVPLPELQSITSITYYDTDETAATWTATNYIVDTYSDPGRVSLGYGLTYPTTTLRPVNGIIVRFVAGYGDAESNIPDNVKQAIRLLVGHLYENRENTWIKPLERIPMGVEALLWQERVGIV
jgi:uncharacterized phiE125 gp8 family phage protein